MAKNMSRSAEEAGAVDELTLVRDCFGFLGFLGFLGLRARFVLPIVVQETVAESEDEEVEEEEEEVAADSTMDSDEVTMATPRSSAWRVTMIGTVRAGEDDDDKGEVSILPRSVLWLRMRF